MASGEGSVDDGVIAVTLELINEKVRPGVLVEEGETGCSTGAKVFKSSNTFTKLDTGLFAQSISRTDALPLEGWMYDAPGPLEIPTRA